MNFELLYSQFPVLEGDKVLLKKIEEKDAEDLYLIHSNEKVYEFIPGKVKKNPKTVANMVGHYERDFHKKKMIFLGIYYADPQERLVGLAEIFDIDKKVDMATIGYRLNPDFWGKGIATQTTKLLVKYLIDVIGVNRIQAFVMPENEQSQKVLLKNSFTYEGTSRQGHFWKDKGLIDLQVYSLLRENIGSIYS